MPIGLADVAARAGVSASTASEALSGKVGSRVARATRLKIAEAARELHYQPNRFAKSMRTGRSNAIGLMVSRLTNPFFARLVADIEDIAANSNFDVLIDGDYMYRASNRFVGRAAGWPVDGVLMWALPNLRVSQFLGNIAAQTPIVYLGYERGDGADFVMTDLYSGSTMAMHHLLARGYRRIAFLPDDANPEWLDVDPKYLGYRDVCREAGIPVQIVPLNSDVPLYQANKSGVLTVSYETGVRFAAERRSAPRPEAVLCASDVIAIGFGQGIMRGGLTVPEDVALIGFDGIEAGQCLARPLTSVTHDIIAIASSSVEALNNRISGRAGDEPQQIRIPTGLRVGETT